MFQIFYEDTIVNSDNVIIFEIIFFFFTLIQRNSEHVLKKFDGFGVEDLGICCTLRCILFQDNAFAV